MQLVAGIERATAALSAGSDPSPVPPDLTPAPRAFRYPFCGWGGNRWATAAGAITAKEPRRCFPHPIVSVAGSHQRVRDFVQDGVSDLLLRIQEREFPAHGDGARAVLTGTESTHSTVKLEVPMGELVFGHQPVGESLCFFQDHRLVEGLIERLIEASFPFLIQAREKVQGGLGCSTQRGAIQSISSGKC